MSLEERKCISVVVVCKEYGLSINMPFRKVYFFLLPCRCRTVTHAWVNTHADTLTHARRLKCVLSRQDDEVVLQCVACIQKENRKFCLAAEGLGNRLCYLEPTSEAKVGNAPPPTTPPNTRF